MGILCPEHCIQVDDRGMTDDLNLALEVDVLAASLSLDQRESGDLLTLLAQKFEKGLPRNTQVERRLFGLGAVYTVTLCFDDYHYQVSREQYGDLSAKVIKVVRGIKIKTTELPTAEWSQQVAEALARMAVQNAEVREALTRFVVG